MRIKRFEELECWQEARNLTKIVYSDIKRSEFFKDFRLDRQISGASISMMNNISQGFDSRSNNEFVRFLTYLRRSCSEVKNCLYIALDQKYIPKKEFQRTYKHCEKVRKIIDGLIRYLRTIRQLFKLSKGLTGTLENRTTGSTVAFTLLTVLGYVLVSENVDKGEYVT